MPRAERFQFDRAYVDRLIAEDPDTERHFVGYFSDLLRLKLRGRLRSAAQIDDARQETFARVLTSLKRKGGLATPEALGAFVNSVCDNVVLEMYRAGSRADQFDDHFDKPDDRIVSAESSVMAGEDRLRVRAALASLPAKERDLLTRLFFDDADKDEICRELNVDRNYLRVLLHRAKARFRSALQGAETG